MRVTGMGWTGVLADLASPLHSHRTITEIAFAWGFNNSAHFNRLFKERYGLSARAYRY